MESVSGAGEGGLSASMFREVWRVDRNDTMNWQAMESKMFTAAAYEAQRRILYLRFTSGDVYRYLEFPKSNTDSFWLPSRADDTS